MGSFGTFVKEVENTEKEKFTVEVVSNYVKSLAL